ncbi:hypothetical protein ACIHFB_19195 [Streptomyces sp. NPDC051963]|uniref:hypothetical protein n=1 Tax=Streptomyces sp. NPDC051963 TaxID=3365678 RepID=UPI0037CD6E28
MRARPAVGSPFQLLLLAASFALAGYAGVRLLEGDWFEVALWFVGAALVHDLVLLPLYTAADRALVTAFGAAGRRWAVGYVRVPAALSLLLLLVWFPLISGRVADHFDGVTGLNTHGYPARWLLMTAALFAGSAVLFVRRLRRAAKERPPEVH